MIDGEIVIATARGLDFDALQMRLHPAASRVAKLAQETPAAFVAFDLLAAEGTDLRDAAAERAARAAREAARRRQAAAASHADDARSCSQRRLARALRRARASTASSQAADGTYQPGKRAMIKVKHVRDRRLRGGRLPLVQGRAGCCRLAAARAVRREGVLHHVGVDVGLPLATRKQLVRGAAPLRRDAIDKHPWREWAEAADTRTRACRAAHSRWSAGKDLAWEPLRIERVCEVKYDHLQGDRFRHAAVFLRWRPDKPPHDRRSISWKPFPVRNC